MHIEIATAADIAALSDLLSVLFSQEAEFTPDPAAQQKGLARVIGEPEIGAIMLFTAMDGSEMPGVIREVNGDSITVDFNHPLAGRTVHFDIEVLEIDPALEE